jgi:uncharacterized protein YydD (DUF2326 family)
MNAHKYDNVIELLKSEVESFKERQGPYLTDLIYESAPKIVQLFDERIAEYESAIKLLEENQKNGI